MVAVGSNYSAANFYKYYLFSSSKIIKKWIINLINNKLDTSPNDILYTSKSWNRKEEAHKIEYTYIEQTYTTNITEEKET